MSKGEKMEENLLLLEKREGVGIIAFNRPERRNALSPLLLYQLSEMLNQLKMEDEIRCVVLKGAGDKAFSSGYDITAIPTNISPEVMEALKTKNPLQMALEAIQEFPYPVIAMINGMALGAGCELAMTCDIRIAVDTARLGMPPAKLGLVYMPAGIMRFVNVAGLANAKEIFFTGRYFPASRAKEMGLVHYLLPMEQLLPFTEEMAQEIAGNAPLSLKGMKTIFNAWGKSQQMEAEDRKEIERLVAQAFNSEDLKEGQKAFFEKRNPIFKGR
ncbi:MAG: enoyl-CoA hydratase-related protein [Thermodesulfobacteriota bacterium]|nr:enoyl-CoA hydratase-related protein [Thermodesulfobacteriota bacterium]